MFQQVEKETIPCGHINIFRCNEEATSSQCNQPCGKPFECGHPCEKMCKEQCDPFCDKRLKMDKPGLCGHTFSVPHYFIDNIGLYFRSKNFFFFFLVGITREISSIYLHWKYIYICELSKTKNTFQIYYFFFMKLSNILFFKLNLT